MAKSSMNFPKPQPLSHNLILERRGSVKRDNCFLKTRIKFKNVKYFKLVTGNNGHSDLKPCSINNCKIIISISNFIKLVNHKKLLIQTNK